VNVHEQPRAVTLQCIVTATRKVEDDACDGGLVLELLDPHRLDVRAGNRNQTALGTDHGIGQVDDEAFRVRETLDLRNYGLGADDGDIDAGAHGRDLQFAHYGRVRRDETLTALAEGRGQQQQ
jgi:hypothetical protein